ncbi:MAG TPA: hypothetical protein VGU46_10960 [Acidobacteriaceae bacterium]|nr:hypothetical protein [Acidobacteriaceae bacterium]
MSATMTPLASVAPIARRVRAYFAPVNRAAGAPTLFDAAQLGNFSLDTPPAPWIDLGWVSAFARKSGTKVDPLRTGAPASTAAQVRSEIEATVSLEFESWGKLQMALASGSQQTNLLTTATGAAANGSGGVAAAPVPLLTGTGPASTATALNVGATAAATFSVGSLVAVDVDYTGQLGYVGTGVSSAYVQSASAVANDVNFIRRVTLNVGVVIGIADGVLQLADPLPAGVPAAGMQVSRLVGFCDREGASFFQEWSALFVMQGAQGDRVLYHYPRLQAMQGSAERSHPLAAPLECIRLAAAFRALPVKDANDGETVLCFRSYLPAALRTI